MRSHLAVVLTLAILCAGAAAAQFKPIGEALPTGWSQGGAPAYNFGYSFSTTATNVTVVQLGCCTFNGAAVPMHLWDSTATSAPIATITTASGSVGQWRWGNLSSPLLLVASRTYVVTMLSDAYYFTSKTTIPPAFMPTGTINYIDAIYAKSTTPTYPTLTQNTYFGPADIAYTQGPGVFPSISSLNLGTAYQGQAGAESGYTVAGVQTTGPTTISAPTGVEVALSQSGPYAGTQVISTTGDWGPTSVWARISASAPLGAISGNITHVSTGMTTANIAVSGQVDPPQLIVSPPSLAYGSETQGTPSSAQSYDLSGGATTGPTTITAPTGVEVSFSQTGPWTPGLTVSTTGTWGPTAIWVRIAAAAPLGTINADVTNASSGLATELVAITAQVNPPPSLEVHELGYSGPFVAYMQSATGTNRDFGSQDIDSGPTAAINIVLYNQTSSNVTVGIPTLTGAAAGHFALNTSTITNPVPPAGQTFFTVAFNPYDIGQLTAQISFTHNASAPSQNPFLFDVTGNGSGNPPALEVHEIAVSGPWVANGASAANGRDFGTIQVGSSSSWLNLIVWNRFTTDTTVTPLPGLSAGDVGDFTVNAISFVSPIPGNPGFTGQSWFSVLFAPGSAGQKTATISFGHTASNPGSPYTFEVTGLGLVSGPAIRLEEVASPPIVITNGAPAANGRDFGNQAVAGGATAYVTIDVSNPGTTDLTLGNPTLTGANPGEFVLDLTGFNQTVPASSSTQFQVAFDPTSIGQQDATVEFTHDATTSTTSPFAFDVTGNGTNNAPILQVREGGATGPLIANGAAATGTGRDFGSRDVNAGAGASLTIYIENTGTGDLNLGAATLTGADAAHFTLNTSGYSTPVAATGNTAFTVAFDPSSLGAKSATVEFTHNDTGTATPFSFEVTGTGTGPAIEVNDGGAIVGYGDAAVGARDFGSFDLSALPSPMLTITVTNIGSGAVTLVAPVLSGPNPANFTLDISGFSTSLAPSANTSFTITFDATQVGLKEATVAIGHNDPSLPDPFIFEIAGTATSAGAVLITSGANLPPAGIGLAYPTVTLAASGGTTPYSWALRPGNSLPPGMILGPAGSIDGIPGVAGNYSFEIRVTDALGGTDDRVFNLNVGSGSTGAGRGRGGGGCISGSTSLPLLLLLLGLLVLAPRLRREDHSCGAR